jgi:AcrR family transcriptional regulator
MTGQQRREQLLGVARGLFAEKGFEATTVEDIAERAGVTRPVVYEHFGGKQGIYAVVVDREVRALTEAIAAPLRNGTRPRAAAEGAAQAFLAYIDSDAEGFLILARDAPVGTGRGSFASVLADVADEAEGLLVATFEASGLPTDAAPMYARMLVGAVALLGEWWLETREHPRELVAAHAVNLLWNGLVGLEADPRLHLVREDRDPVDDEEAS